jgi:uncharacterized membrane protein YbaN (DUF454 family)
VKTLVKNYFYIFLGTFFLIIGIIGIFLPLLPTTPFLILTAFFYSRSSEKFHNWLMNHKWLGPPIHDWNERGAINSKVKILSTIMVFIMSFVVLSREIIPIWAKITYSLMMIGVLVFIWTRPNS